MNPRNQQGFTLAEILIAMIVISILAASVVYVLRGQTSMGARNSDMMRSVSIAKEKLDSLKVSTYDSLSSGSDTVGERYLRSWDVTALQEDGVLNGRKKIILTVYWPLTAEHNVNVATIVSDDRYKEGQ